jgi:hypothetical protein
VYLSAGRLVFGFLSGYAQEEGINSGARFFLYDWVRSLPGMARLPLAAYAVFCAAVLGGIAWGAWRYAAVERLGPHPFAMELRKDGAPKYVRAAMWMAFAMMLLFSPHYPWYIVWLVPLFALAPNLPLLAYLMDFFYLFTTELADPGPKMFLLNEILYGFVAVVMVLQWTVLRRWPLRRILRMEE